MQEAGFPGGWAKPVELDGLRITIGQLGRGLRQYRKGMIHNNFRCCEDLRLVIMEKVTLDESFH
jgi:hypothetical protein